MLTLLALEETIQETAHGPKPTVQQSRAFPDEMVLVLAWPCQTVILAFQKWQIF